MIERGSATVIYRTLYLNSAMNCSWKPLNRVSMSFIRSDCGRIVVL